MTRSAHIRFFSIVVVLAVLPVGQVLANQAGNFGSNDYSTGSGCNACHAVIGPYNPQTSLTGPNEIAINTWVPFFLQLTENGAPFPPKGGFQLSTRNGSVRPVNAASQIAGETVAHTLSGKLFRG